MKRYFLGLTLLIFVAGFAFAISSMLSKEGEKSHPIKIGINEWMGYDPLILADKEKLFERNGVSVEVKRYTSATLEMEAIKRGELDGAGFTLDEAFALIASGFKGKIVLLVDYSMGGDMLIGQEDITDIPMLEGKKIGYEGSVVGEFLLQRALESFRLRSGDITLVEVDATDWLSAFKEKEVDALVCFNPVATELLDKHLGNTLFSSADIPFEIIDVLIFSESFYKGNTEAVSNVLNGWFDALDYIESNLDKAADIISTEKNITSSNYKEGLAGLVHPTYAVNKEMMSAESKDNIYKRSQVVVDFMISRGLLSKRVDTAVAFSQEALALINRRDNFEAE